MEKNKKKKFHASRAKCIKVIFVKDTMYRWKSTQFLLSFRTSSYLKEKLQMEQTKIHLYYIAHLIILEGTKSTHATFCDINLWMYRK